MNHKKAKRISGILRIAGGAIMLLGVATNLNLIVVGVLVVFSCLIPMLLFNKCPHCGKNLGNKSSEYCPYCGESLDD